MTEFERFRSFYEEKVGRPTEIQSGIQLDIYVIKLFKEFTDDVEWIINNCSEIKKKIININEFKNDKIEDYLIYQMILEYSNINQNIKDGFQRNFSVEIDTKVNVKNRSNRNNKRKEKQKEKEKEKEKENEKEPIHLVIEKPSLFGKSTINYRNIDLMLRPVEDIDPFGKYKEQENRKKRKL